MNGKGWKDGTYGSDKEESREELVNRKGRKNC